MNWEEEIGMILQSGSMKYPLEHTNDVEFCRRHLINATALLTSHRSNESEVISELNNLIYDFESIRNDKSLKIKAAQLERKKERAITLIKSVL